MKSYLYAQGYVRLVTPNDIDWVNDTIKIALLDNTHTPDLDNDTWFTDVNADEVSGTGYTAGGMTLANRTVNYDSSARLIERKADNPAWPTSTITARYAVIYKDTGSAATSPLIAYCDFEVDISSSASTFTVLFDVSSNENRVIMTRLLV